MYVDICKIQHAVVAVGFNHTEHFHPRPSGMALVKAGLLDVRSGWRKEPAGGGFHSLGRSLWE
jgi:hypothetical protein